MDYRQYLDSEDMTEEEQYGRIVQLLALACARMAKKERTPTGEENGADNPQDGVTPAPNLSA